MSETRNTGSEKLKRARAGADRTSSPRAARSAGRKRSAGAERSVGAERSAAGAERFAGAERSAGAERTAGAVKKTSRGGNRGGKSPRQTRVLKQRLLVIGGILVALIVWYSVIANTYRRRFLPHTYINGFDMGKMSVADAEAVLKKSVENYSLELAFRGGDEEVLTSENIDLTYVSSNEVEKILAAQNRAGWIRNAFGKRTSYAVSTSFKFDSAKLRAYLESLPAFQEANITKPKNAHIVRKKNNTFRVATEVEGNEPNEEAMFAAVDKAINASESRLNLAAYEGAYVEPSVRQDDEDLNYTAERFNSFVDCNITLKLRDGTTETYGRDDFVTWVTYNEDTESWSLSKDSVYTKCWAIMQDIADRYDDTKSTVEYTSTNVGTVVIPCAYYGYMVDVEGETDLMYEALINREDREIEIVNSVSETMDPKKGGTYVEVDVTNQHVIYYKDFQPYMEMDCVTGKESDPERRTPSGVYSVLNKLENQILGSLTALDPGQRYESHVDVWMPFFESYGMHDASWRENFGGSMYGEYGSHGCVNLPPEDAIEMFKVIDYYTPVIVVREGDNAPEGTRRGDTTWNPPDGGLHYSEES